MGAIAIVPSIGVGGGSLITSAAMNLMMLMSFGMFAWMTWINSEEEEEEPQGRPYPIPRFLSDRILSNTINIACIGAARCGKSSLVNALLRLRLSDAQAAKAGQATLEPEPHVFMCPDGGREAADEASGEVCCTDVGALTPRMAVCLWDMPTAEGDLCCNSKELGLAYFDAVFILYAGRLSDAESSLAKELDVTHNVPCFLVRTQLDVDIENELWDNGRTEEDIVPNLRREVAAQGTGPAFLVSAREPERHDMQRLRASISAVARARGRAKQQTECPICFGDFHHDGLERCACNWCGNVVCSRCRRKLDGGQGEALCPFCRRWTSASKLPAGRES